jgi:Arc/MetJ-type ribon-helix-helix transcriptional regulator
MPRSIHVRLDAAAEAALEVVRADGMNDSEAVRAALRETAARRRLRSALREEAARLAADPEDREEMNTIREQMADLAPPLE